MTLPDEETQKIHSILKIILEKVRSKSVNSLNTFWGKNSKGKRNQKRRFLCV